MPVLYLGSSSSSRRFLLEQAKISFIVLSHDADERSIDWQQPDFLEVVKKVALLKMDHVLLPSEVRGPVWVLTADTLVQSASTGRVYGKPEDNEAARAMLQDTRHGLRVATGFCLDRKVYDASCAAWRTDEQKVVAVVTDVLLALSDVVIDRYLAQFPDVLHCAGALAVEGFGMQFVERINGSYSNVIGLPLVELRQALEQLGFFAYSDN